VNGQEGGNLRCADKDKRPITAPFIYPVTYSPLHYRNTSLIWLSGAVAFRHVLESVVQGCRRRSVLWGRALASSPSICEITRRGLAVPLMASLRLGSVCLSADAKAEVRLSLVGVDVGLVKSGA
jgi:hypothetical protein